MLNHKSLASTQVYARLSVEPVRRALDEQAERMLGPVVSLNEQRQTQRDASGPLIPVVSVSEQRQEWPG